MRLKVLKTQQREDAHSPEFSYLYSFCLAQAREVFERVTVSTWAPVEVLDNPPLALDEADAVLVLGPDNVLLGAASLERMRQLVADGASVVLPSPLHHYPSAGGEEIFTLGGFERVEKQILANDEAPREAPGSQMPVALFSPRACAEIVDRFGLVFLFGDEDLLERAELSPRSAGVYHLFADYYGQLRDDIAPHLPPAAEDVLEVGCARGLTGAWIQDRLGCRVTGVELHPEAAQEAKKRLHRVIVGDIETLDLEAHRLTGGFDAVVATELFEHLNYPERFLARMKQILKPGGRIVLSVPNVGHYSVVEDLLAGRWDYLPIGLLCYTHFRFFTRATLEDWIRRAEFASSEIVAQTTALPERLGPVFETLDADLDSLRTKGFYVVLER